MQVSQECLETRPRESKHACKFLKSLTRPGNDGDGRRAEVGPHLLAAEGEAGTSGSLWRQGWPKSQEWISSCSASETSLGCEVCKHKHECQAIEVIGQDWSSEVVALVL